MKTAMDDKTARKYRDDGKRRVSLAAAHTWRTREDPFTEVWCEVHEQLAVNSAYRARRCSNGCSGSIQGVFKTASYERFSGV